MFVSCYKYQVAVSKRNIMDHIEQYLENNEKKRDSPTRVVFSMADVFHTRVSTSWTPPFPQNYHYLKIIFPSKSRVLTECGHRQHHELGEYETTHSLYFSYDKFLYFHYRLRSRFLFISHSRMFSNSYGYVSCRVTVNRAHLR